MRVAVALSCGVDALSGRAAPVLSELHAIGLARQLSADLVGVHVGAAMPLLRDYAAYGLNRIDVLMDNAAEERGAGLVGAALAAWLRANTDIRILVTGHRACGGLDSGLVPFEVAHALDWAVVSDVAEVVGASDTEEKSSGALQVLQARPRGVRRPVFIEGACVLAAHDRTGNVPVRVHAIGRAAHIENVHLTTTSDEGQDNGVQGDIRPWRARPRLMSGTSDATKGSGNVLVAPSADEAARAIMNHLRQLGLGPSGAASRNVTQ